MPARPATGDPRQACRQRLSWPSHAEVQHCIRAPLCRLAARPCTTHLRFAVQVVVFTASLGKYADPLLDLLDKVS